MKKKVIMISAIAGMLVLGLCVKFAAGSRDAASVNSVALAGGIVSAEGIWSEEPLSGKESGQQEKMEEQAELEEPEGSVIPEKILLEKPVMELNGEEGELRYDWNQHVIRVDDDTLLFVSDGYFSAERLQQRIVYLAKAPDFVPQEVFRQDSRVYEEAPDVPELLERRMPSPKLVEEGFVFEADGMLYFLDDEFQETVLLCDLRELMGENYLFSPWRADQNKCDVTADASKLLACTDEGLYEYDLENNGRKLLEPAVFTPHEIIHVEGDCDCGETGFTFDGPVKAEYVPGGQGYVFLTGTEYGDPMKITLRSAEGKTLYQEEVREYIDGFMWVEAEDTVYLMVFYQEGDCAWLERVDAYTGEKEVFVVPEKVFFDGYLYTDFLDADHLIYCSEQTPEIWNMWENSDIRENDYKIYQLSDEEVIEPEDTGDINGKLVILDLTGRKTIIRYSDSSARMYEDFLNGEIMVELGEQYVYIDELFWDNDIEYCFLDIDGDGSGELQIRDNTIYYVVKVQEGALRVIWVGWWNYEPVLADGRCGILHYADGYGSEWIEFSTMSADGSMEKEDSICWSDENKNGKLDEGDFFYDSGDIDREHYLTKREEYAAMRSENELEWTGRRLKDFATWQDAYIDFILKIHVTEWEPDVGFLYSLLYVDADDVPELCIDTRVAVSGELIVSFYDGKVRCVNRERGGMRYIERGGLLYNDYGAMGFYPCNIYLLEKGEFSEIGTGWYSDYADEQGNIYYDYFWEEKPVTEAAFEACIDALIDRTKCVEPSLWYSEAKILKILVE